MVPGQTASNLQVAAATAAVCEALGTVATAAFVAVAVIPRDI